MQPAAAFHTLNRNALLNDGLAMAYGTMGAPAPPSQAALFTRQVTFRQPLGQAPMPRAGCWPDFGPTSNLRLESRFPDALIDRLCPRGIGRRLRCLFGYYGPCWGRHPHPNAPGSRPRPIAPRGAAGVYLPPLPRVAGRGASCGYDA